MNLRRALFAAFIAATVVVTACGGAGSGGTKPAVTVGSTNFFEQLTLGELYSQILEANGYTVTRKFNLGNREIVEPTMTSGRVSAVGVAVAVAVAVPVVLPPPPVAPHAVTTTDAAMNAAKRARRRFMWDPPRP